jgi:plasmid stabilization system protein ParE
MKIVWSPLALERVEDIARYIAEDKPDAAVRWVDELFSTVERLADFPKSGRMVPEVGSPRIRELIFGTYRVIYSVKYQVGILTVRRSSQLLRVSELGDDET